MILTMKSLEALESALAATTKVRPQTSASSRATKIAIQPGAGWPVRRQNRVRRESNLLPMVSPVLQIGAGTPEKHTRVSALNVTLNFMRKLAFQIEI